MHKKSFIFKYLVCKYALKAYNIPHDFILRRKAHYFGLCEPVSRIRINGAVTPRLSCRCGESEKELGSQHPATAESPAFFGTLRLGVAGRCHPAVVRLILAPDRH